MVGVKAVSQYRDEGTVYCSFQTILRRLRSKGHVCLLCRWARIVEGIIPHADQILPVGGERIVDGVQELAPRDAAGRRIDGGKRRFLIHHGGG